MEESADVRAAWSEFCERLSAGDVASFDRFVSSHPATVVIGTAPGEIVRERERLRHGFEVEGVGLTPGDPVAFAEGSLTWLVDEPAFSFPGGSTMQTRFTVVLRREDGRWKVLHMHASVGVPDEEVVALQERWEQAAAGR
jgi:hypothetical protein